MPSRPESAAERAENQPNFGFEMLVLADHPNEIARMHIVELVTRAFVEHVGAAVPAG